MCFNFFFPSFQHNFDLAFRIIVKIKHEIMTLFVIQFTILIWNRLMYFNKTSLFYKDDSDKLHGVFLGWFLTILKITCHNTMQLLIGFLFKKKKL